MKSNNFDPYTYIAEKLNTDRSTIKWAMVPLFYGNIDCGSPKSDSLKDQTEWCDAIILKFLI